MVPVRITFLRPLVSPLPTGPFGGRLRLGTGNSGIFVPDPGLGSDSPNLETCQPQCGEIQSGSWSFRATPHPVKAEAAMVKPQKPKKCPPPR
jgi:hypothetical protein